MSILTLFVMHLEFKPEWFKCFPFAVAFSCHDSFYFCLYSNLGGLLCSRALQTHTTILPPTLHRRSPATAQDLQDRERGETFCKSIILNSDPNAEHWIKILWWYNDKCAHLLWEGQELSSKGGSSSSSMYSSMYIWSKKKEEMMLIQWVTFQGIGSISQWTYQNP